MANPYATENFLRKRGRALQDALRNLTLAAHMVLETDDVEPLDRAKQELAAAVAEAEACLRSSSI